MPLELTKLQYQAILEEISKIYEDFKNEAISSLSQITLKAYREIGRKIIEVEQKNSRRAKYGAYLIENLSRDLTEKYGHGFSARNLKYMRQYYRSFPMGHNCAQLNWSQYKLLSSIEDEQERAYYEGQAIENSWDIKALKSELRKNKIKLEKIKQALERSADSRTKKKTAKISVARGVLNIYQIICPDIGKDRGKLLIDCGFGFWREMPIKGIDNPKPGDILKAEPAGSGFRFKESAAGLSRIYTYTAALEKIIDGDTIKVVVDCGLKGCTPQKLRFRNIDAPEISTKKGIKARQFVEDALGNLEFLIVKTYKTYTQDKYGRYLADIFYLKGEGNPEIVAAQGKYLNQELVDRGFAVKV